MMNTEWINLIISYFRNELDETEQAELQRLRKKDPELEELFQLASDLARESNTTNWEEFRGSAKKVAGRIVDDFFKSRGKPDSKRGVMIFDSRLLPTPTGIRPVALDAQHLRYRLGEMNLDITLNPISPDSSQLVGQLLGSGVPIGLRVELHSDGKQFSTLSDDLGLFTFERIPSDSYEIVLLVENNQIGTVSVKI